MNNVVANEAGISGKPKLPVNDNAAQFGDVVKRILGEHADIALAAERLGYRPRTLKKILLGEIEIAEQSVNERNWQDAFARHYPEGWKKHRTAFLRSLGKLKEFRGKKRFTVDILKYGEWEKAVGTLVADVLKENGDSPADFQQAVTVRALKDQKVLDKIISGDSYMATSLYRDALREICTAYSLEEKPGRSFARATYLLGLKSAKP